MSWQFTLLSTPTLLALVVSMGMLGYIVTAYRDRRRDPIVILYFSITIATIVWTGFSALKLLHTDPATKLLFYRLLHVGAALLPPLIFLFVLTFTDRVHWLRYDILSVVFFLPVGFLVLLFVGPDGLIVAGTRLVDTDLVILRVADGPGFILFSIYSIVLVGATLGLVVLELRRFGWTYYPQAILLGIAVGTPMLFSALTTAGVPPFGGDKINLVPTSAAVSVVLFGVLLYRYRLVDLPPLAYATAMKYSPDSLFVLDQDGRIVSTNEHGSELLETLNEGVGSSLSNIVPEFDPATTASELFEMGLPSGEKTYQRAFVKPLTRGGTHLGWVVVFRDETDQQRQQQRLQETNEQLELLASTISHDLRNPLSVAEGYRQILQADIDRDELEKIERAHDRMEEIIEEVLTLARVGKRIDELEAVSMEATVNRAWENVTTDGAALAVEGERTMMVDPALIGHIFENLFRNALEHGEKEVTVTVGTIDDGIYVEDDGPGIPPDEREAVFEVGYSNTSGGTGFGLSIVKQIASAHGWSVRVTEGTAGGARFEITGIEDAA